MESRPPWTKSHRFRALVSSIVSGAHWLTLARMDTPKKLLYTKREAAKALGISIRSIDYLVASRELTPRRIGRRVLLPATVLEQFARRDHTEPLSGAVRQES